jgi:hypothetical protein
MPFDKFLAERRRRMAAVVRDAMQRLADTSYEPHMEEGVRCPPPSKSSSCALWSTLTSCRRVARSLTALGQERQRRSFFPTVALYADGDRYDGLPELSDAVGIDGNPWFAWAAELPDGRVLLSVLRETYERDDPAPI